MITSNRGLSIVAATVLLAGASLFSGCGDDTGGSSTTGTSTTGGNGGNGGTGGTAATTGGTGGTGGQQGFNCTAADAQDETGNADVVISDIEAWSIPHEVCVKVDVGTTVTWNGSFAAHPLSGGEPGAPEADSPLTTGDNGGDPSFSATLDSAGSYPYHCTIHGASMQGVIIVE